MSAKSTMAIRASRDIKDKDKLDRLADATRRGRSDVAVEAIEADMERELEIIEGIGRGLADVEAGSVVAHDAAMEQLDTVVADARIGRGGFHGMRV